MKGYLPTPSSGAGPAGRTAPLREIERSPKARCLGGTGRGECPGLEKLNVLLLVPGTRRKRSEEGSNNCPFRPHPTFVDTTLPELAGWRGRHARLLMLDFVYRYRRYQARA